MAKSAKDELIARIEADIASVHAVSIYVGSDGSEKLTARIGDDVARLQGMLNYVTAAVPATANDAPAKPKRGRGPNKKKPGLPAGTTTAVENVGTF